MMGIEYWRVSVRVCIWICVGLQREKQEEDQMLEERLVIELGYWKRIKLICVLEEEDPNIIELKGRL